MRVRTSVPSSSSSFTWESLKVLPQELLGRSEPHIPPVPPPRLPHSFSSVSSTGLDTGLKKPLLTALSPVSQAAGPNQVRCVVGRQNGLE